MTASVWLRLAGGLVLAVAVAGLLFRWPVAQTALGAVRTALLPAVKLTHQTTTAAQNAIRFVSTLRDLHTENLSLRAETRTLRAENVRLRESLKETETVRREFGMAGEVRFQLLAARVVGRDPDLTSDNITINRGRRDGVVMGAAVIAPGDILVGRVVRTDNSSAAVRVLTDPASSVSSITATHRTTGLLKGQKGLGLRLELVEPGREIEQGELVLSSGQDGLFPSGFTIGTISAVGQAQTGVLTTAAVAPAENFRNLETVLVVVGESR
ncbi:rod shape-determining protein MreC [Candidatus Parcubacteria bacterium]|nr:rod shape-determining protein MreC [Candidatus Parcubacteria bacterium]MBI4099114.1 rod shape-determining protein MreC [Candidatus Parcubacteria bacterium]